MYDKRSYLRAGRADVHVGDTYRPVRLGVEGDPGPLEMLACSGPYFARVLANARREHHSVCPVRGGRHCCDLRPKTMKIDVHRENGRRVPTRPMFQELTHIAGKTTRESKEAAPLLKGIGQLPGRNAVGCDPRDRSRIDVARPRRHHETFGWGESHRGVHRSPTRSSGRGGTTAQMANHESEGMRGTFQELCSTTS